MHRIIIRMTNILELLLVLIEGPDISAEPEVDFSGRRVDVSCVFLTLNGGSHKDGVLQRQRRRLLRELQIY